MKEKNHEQRLAQCRKWADMGVKPFVFYCNYYKLSAVEIEQSKNRFYNWWNGRIKDYPTLEKFESMVESIKWS